MRLHKGNVYSEPLHKLLKNLTVEEVENDFGVILSPTNKEFRTNNLIEKYSHFFQNLLTYQSEIKDYPDKNQLLDRFRLALKRLLPIKDAAILFFDENHVNLSSIESDAESELVTAMNHYLKEGILNIIFESNKPMMLPELSSFKSDKAKLNFIIFPIVEDRKKIGLLCILSSVAHKNFAEEDKHLIQILLDLTLARIDKIVLKGKLNESIEELQLYQAKLSNDFRLSAIGEMTQGIVEDILTPLQVIMMQVDFLDQNEESPEIKKIKSQVKKVNESINRLVKFANINQKDVKIHPCNINEIISDYYNLVKSTLESLDLEFVLDFEDEIPSILSHSNYIYQLLTNAIGLIKNKNAGSGGIILNTRHKNDHIVLRIITTQNIKAYSPENGFNYKSQDLNVKIIENLMDKHEGSFSIESFEKSGSAIIFNFPIRRKIRK